MRLLWFGGGQGGRLRPLSPAACINLFVIGFRLEILPHTKALYITRAQTLNV